MLMKGDYYYDMLACQKIHDLTNELNLTELALCFQHHYVEDLRQKLLKAIDVRNKLRAQHSEIDRELAKLDGRHTQCENPEVVLGRERRKRQKARSRDIVSQLSDAQKQELLKALGAI